MIRPGIVAASKRRSAVASVKAFVAKHYVIARVQENVTVHTAKHYVIAKPI